jgi:DinB superfamily
MYLQKHAKTYGAPLMGCLTTCYGVPTMMAGRFKAPEIISPKGIFQNLDNARRFLAQSRQKLLSLISSTEVDVLRTHVAPHPVFGMLNFEQRMQLLALHERRHIAQIEEMKESLQ